MKSRKGKNRSRGNIIAKPIKVEVGFFRKVAEKCSDTEEVLNMPTHAGPTYTLGIGRGACFKFQWLTTDQLLKLHFKHEEEMRAALHLWQVI